MILKLKIKCTTREGNSPEKDITALIRDSNDLDEIANLVQIGSKSSDVIKKYNGRATVKYPYLLISLNIVKDKAPESIIDELAEEMDYGWLEDLGEFTSEKLNLVVRPRISYIEQKIEIVESVDISEYIPSKPSSTIALSSVELDENPLWLEIKYDGFRGLLTKEGEDYVMYSSSGAVIRFAGTWRALARAFADRPRGAMK